jgi:hypothetical protein
MPIDSQVSIIASKVGTARLSKGVLSLESFCWAAWGAWYEILNQITSLKHISTYLQDHFQVLEELPITITQSFVGYVALSPSIKKGSYRLSQY